MYRILVTAIGSFSADIVIEVLREAGHYVIGADIYPKEWIADASNVDKFYQVPYATDAERYVETILNICEENEVHYVIPLTDPEVDVLSGLKPDFREIGTDICISDEHSIRLCRNKYALSKFLKEKELCNVIETSRLSDSELEHIKLPVFIKPVSGRSSIGCRFVYTEEEYLCIKNVLKGEEYIVQPFVAGEIITVDVVRDQNSEVTVSIPRVELLRNSSGAGTTVEIIESEELERTCENVARETFISGAVNIEFIRSESGKLFLLEINPRFSGGVKFSHISGYNVVENHLNCFTGRPIEDKKINKMIIARKYTEHVTSEFSG
ncbi:D-alanine--D-alanine ligase [Andreesenia angusta]|uniref:D-alanine--D-alanine ligase n=1 Tax=Andreesenia angusta TaxID=39480 RepID=A0A1S1V673_9FIRM|nr:ATP-grasp domain-containing protein [Andreesenia angusta]OHW61870.1 D-alanine--D-alanine ligase [Andreesenia angusta]